MNEESLFAAALAKTDAAERQAFLDQACAGDPALRQRLDRLLAADEHTAGILERGPGPGAPDGRPPERPGAAVGPYKLIEPIGEGGMGAVWLAQQQEPVKRLVAVKLIKAGMDTRQVIARFEAERQALALMDHPNIAKVLDAGTTTADRPYFVMDLVRGVPITKYCDAHRLTPRQRLELFLPVCGAVQHAHQKGVIHRDLKPSNVLVAPYDGKPVPKVIDFGVAKAAGQSLTDKTLVTGLGTIVGTLEYMSPEQAEINQLDVDTRSDIYSLGVLLYELLTGSPPFTRKQLEKAGMVEMLRVIREEEPTKPSAKLSTAEGLPTLAANRGTEPAKLTKLVKGELDWIVMKALEKDRSRRYETANGLAMDVQRYLADEPVEASPPSRAYRLKKFLRRHRGPVLAASVIFLLLVGGIVGTSVGLKLASDRLAQVEAEQRRADQERSIARAVDDFVQKDLLGQADIANQAGGARDRNITVRELLDRAAQGLAKRFQGQERTEAAIRLTLGRTYQAVDEYAKAQEHLERSRALREKMFGPRHPDTLESVQHLARLHCDRGAYSQAERLYRQVLEVRRADQGGDHPDTLQSLQDLGSLYLQRGQYDKAEPLLRDALEGRRARLGADHLDTLLSMNSLALLHRRRAQYHRAEPLYKQVLAGRRKQLGPDHPRILTAMNSLAALYVDWGQYDKAGPLFRRVLTAQRAKLGADHTETLDTMNNLAHLYQVRGRYDRAESLYQQVLQVRRAKLGADHPDTILSTHNLGTHYLLRQRYDKAEPLLKQVLAAQRAKRGTADPNTIIPLLNLGTLYRDRGRYRAAEPLLREALAGARKAFGLGHPTTYVIVWHLANLYAKQGTPDRAEPVLREMVAYLRDHPEPGSSVYGDQLGALAENLLQQKKHAEAEVFARKCLAIRAKEKPGGWATFLTRSLVGGALLGQKKYAEAEPFLVEGYTGMKKCQAPIPPTLRFLLTEGLERLVQLYDAWGKPDQAAKWRKEQEAVRKQRQRPGR
jgi:serine/threonine protein kinase/tetratricopeptide (TPR) repeat protein